MSDKTKEINDSKVNEFQDYLNTLDAGTHRVVMGRLASNSIAFRLQERAAAVHSRAAKANAKYDARVGAQVAPVAPVALPELEAAPAPAPAPAPLPATPSKR